MSKRSERLRDERHEMMIEQGGMCAACGFPLWSVEAQMAHKIPDAIWAKAKWGPGVIDHRLNKALTHPGACNDAMLIQNKPLACERLVAEIRKEIEREAERLATW